MLYLGQQLKRKSDNKDCIYVGTEIDLKELIDKGEFTEYELKTIDADGVFIVRVPEAYLRINMDSLKKHFEIIRDKEGKILPGPFILGNHFFGILKKGYIEECFMTLEEIK